MSLKIVEVSEVNELQKVVDFARVTFENEEGKYYNIADFKRAQATLNQEILNTENIFSLVRSKKAVVIALEDKGTVLASLCYIVKLDRILFFTVSRGEYQTDLSKVLFECLLNRFKKNENDFTIGIFSFLSDVKTLEKVGFHKFKTIPIYNNSLMLLPMYYSKKEFNSENA